MGGIQAALIIALRIAKNREVEWPLTLMAVLSACLLAAGVLRHYWDIYMYRTVRGISFIFVAIDAAGDLFSLISVFFQATLDAKGMAIYATELALWLGVFACGGYFNLLPWVKRKVQEKRSRQAAVQQDSGQESGQSEEQRHGAIALHALPSSTSVFRTPSSEIMAVRARTNNP
jgi:hypothetical protein